MASINSVFGKFMQSVIKSEQSKNSVNDDVDDDTTDDKEQKKDENKKVDISETVKYLTPRDTVSTTDIAPYFFPIFFASERGCLGIWDKEVGRGYIKRRIDIDGTEKFHVLEIVNSKQSLGTRIECPRKEFMALHVTLPHLVLVVKNLRRNFSFEVQVLDSRGLLRRFNIATWFLPSNLKKWSFLCQLPLSLELGWNEIHLDLNDLLLKTYRTTYLETVRIAINANCRLRQIFFCGDHIINGEMPVPSMKIFDNMKMVTPNFGNFNHPAYHEPGSYHCLTVPLPDPPLIPKSTRAEKDLRLIHIQRFNELNKTKLREPFRSHFKKLIENSKANATSLNALLQMAIQKNRSASQVSSKSSSTPSYKVSQSTTTTTKPPSSATIDDEDVSYYSVPIPTGSDGPVNLVQLLKRSMSQPARPKVPYNTAMLMSDDNNQISYEI